MPIRRKKCSYVSLIVFGALCQLMLTLLVQAQTEQHITQLNHKEATVRLYGAYALGIIGDQSTVRPLLQLLKDADSNVRLATIDALGKIGSEQFISWYEKNILERN